MYFSDIQISNYKSYLSSLRLDLTKGINVVVGRNNAGKTALLEALSLTFQANPHRTAETIPTPTTIPPQESSVTFTFTLSRSELLDLLIKVQGDGELYLALPAVESALARQLDLGNHGEVRAKKFGPWFFSHDSFTFRLTREAFGNPVHPNWLVPDDCYLVPNFSKTGSDLYGMFRIDPIKRTFSDFKFTAASPNSSNDFVARIANALNLYIYRFRAERIPSAPCPLGTESTLAADASNLAEVLNLLQQNRTHIEEYNRLVREVLPDIHQVNTKRLDNNIGEVVVWNNKDAISRNDLAFTLNECGSGVGQVLAMLYVVSTAREPQVIILDEPQGFLHPGAVRKLVELLRDYTKEGKHQVILATHSPTVITSADPSSVTMIKQEGAESVFESIDIKNAAQQRMYLGSVGARLSDVFGYDRVLWVEGETEEICFPLILRELSNQPLMGTAILRVQHTGDFNRRDSQNVIAIYERLSQLEGGLVPPVVGFVFDRETRPETEQENLKRRARERIHFTDKRLFENYLLNPIGISAVINSSELDEPKIAEADVVNWLEGKKTDARYYKPLKQSNHEDWSKNINGALLLRDLFADLSKGVVDYDKTKHSPLLTAWVLKNSPEELQELCNLLVSILTGSK